MTISINRNKYDLKLYSNYFGNYSTNWEKPISNNPFEETHLLPQTDKKTLDEVQKAVVTFNSTKPIENVKCSATESAQNIGMAGLNNFLKEVLGIEIPNIPSPIDILDSLANGLLTKCGVSAKKYIENIKSEIEKLKQNSASAKNFKDSLSVVCNGFMIVGKTLLNLPSAILGTLGELGGSLLKKIFGEKAGNALGKVISFCLTPFKLVGNFLFGGIIEMIKHFKSLKEMKKNIGNIVKNILSNSVLEAFRPLINTFRKACGMIPLPELPKQEKMSFGKAIVNAFKFLLAAIITPGSLALKMENDKRFQQEFENEVNNYMQNNKETCNNIIYNNITSMINHIVDLIGIKAKSVADKKLKELKNRVTLYQVSNTKINPKIIILVPQYKTTNSSSNSQEAQKKSENLKRLNELSKLYQQCTLVKDFMTDAQKKELDEIKKTIDNEYKLVNNK